MDVSPVADLVPSLARVLDLVGVFLNAVLGGTIARQRRFDIVGFAILAIVSALGGGMLRDTLLQAGPPVALTDPVYLTTALAGAVVAFFVKLGGRWWTRTYLVGDAIVLGCWAATGAAKALDVGLGAVPAVLLGVTTAVGGGMIRDIVVGRVPAIFGGNTLYATSAVFACLAMLGLNHVGQHDLGLLAAIVVGSGLSIVARWRSWTLPDADTVRLSAWRPPRRRRVGGADPARQQVPPEAAPGEAARPPDDDEQPVGGAEPTQPP
ncbi:trimeric intracellular cation channel family protein [Actinotalea sp. JY-7876]|uniref:trimeric intracellular cation channel family protein n=2 Tax=unclassified Actinotalea TaxID=2638618 RepID=UPI001C7130F2|nr:trimeric intracellular cation channel family protein [Actinotalea sp. JY-7876]